MPFDCYRLQYHNEEKASSITTNTYTTCQTVKGRELGNSYRTLCDNIQKYHTISNTFLFILSQFLWKFDSLIDTFKLRTHVLSGGIHHNSSPK